MRDTEQTPQHNNCLVCLLDSAQQCVSVDDAEDVLTLEPVDIKIHPHAETSPGEDRVDTTSPNLQNGK